MASHPPPPPPPPHGQAPRPPGSDPNNPNSNPGANPGTGRKGGLPDGNYDIFIIPPHSAGGGFLYLPSMQPHRNSFLLGVACTLLSVGLWTLCAPVLSKWFSTLISSGGMGVILLVIGVGVAGWAWGKTQSETSFGGDSSGGGSPGRKGKKQKHQSWTESESAGFTPRSAQSEWTQSDYSSAPPRSDYSSVPPQTDYSSAYTKTDYSPPPPRHANTNTDHSPPPPQHANANNEYSPPPPPPQHANTNTEYSPSPPQHATPKTEYTPPPPQPPKPKTEYTPPPPKHATPKPDYSAPPPKPANTKPDQSTPPPKRETPKSEAASGWEKAREETRKREEERKRAEELRKKREEVLKAKEEAERQRKIKAEKEKWEQARAREKEQRERDARERIAKERAAREAAGKASDTKSNRAPSPKKYEQPSAKSFVGSEDGRPSPAKQRSTYKSSVSSLSDEDRSSYAASHSTARTTPPPSHSGAPYSTTDPTKIQIRAVYCFSDSSPTKPLAELVARRGAVTDGLVLRITSEGLFIDDDVRGVAQREWDVKAWTLKLVEDGMANVPVTPFVAGTLSTISNSGLAALHVLRATARDADHKRYTFVLDEREAWKVAIGLQKLRKGSQVRSLGMSGLKESEVRALLGTLGWM
ncbi:Hypothetical protein R9X50_00112900 [Acrodontium crateriforme]|uniref:Proline-rich protein RiP-15 n=1 Tax=Acrodontium crateriforme TaxID=150365 RepID=A0AAQ3R2L5_9PEZI|nr:Hypothetical protein R9X50_00112900 [Acrodontium crateriforme]